VPRLVRCWVVIGLGSSWVRLSMCRLVSGLLWDLVIFFGVVDDFVV